MGPRSGRSARWRTTTGVGRIVARRYKEETGVSQYEQRVLDHGVVDAQVGERAARVSLRTQIARLERELAAIVADGFPHISPSARTVEPANMGLGFGGRSSVGPRLLDLAELEQLRDSLVRRVQEQRVRVVERTEHERRAQEQLEAMRLEPGRYKWARLPVRDLGQGICGVWEVRPRLGLIGMLAGWWQLKLSSGCPLPRGRAAARP
jgi:hypothetical protein